MKCILFKCGITLRIPVEYYFFYNSRGNMTTVRESIDSEYKDITEPLLLLKTNNNSEYIRVSDISFNKEEIAFCWTEVEETVGCVVLEEDNLHS